MICDALSKDGRIRVYPAWLRGDKPGSGGDLFQFDKQQYDVILLGDVSARQLRAANPNALAAIERSVFEKRTGFLMTGGYVTFGNGDWKGTEIEKLLPVDLSLGVKGQIEKPVKMVPTEAGLRRFSHVLRLADRKEDNVQAWNKLHELDGITRLGPPKDLATVLAVTDDKEPLPVLVAQPYGSGRTLAFAGDTTHRWVRDPQTQQLHDRFWRQVVIWLAQQEEAAGNVWVKPDIRRLPARSDLGFQVGLRSKGGIDLPDGSYQVEVIGPGEARTEVHTARVGNEDRGTFTRTEAPGEYRLVVRGRGKDADGEEVSGEATARFLVYEDDVEMTRRAADHEFLKKLAAAGGGQFHRAEEMTAFLRQLQQQPLTQGKPKVELWPNWRATTRSPFFLWFFLAFVALLTGEWILRRRWEMV